MIQSRLLERVKLPAEFEAALAALGARVIEGPDKSLPRTPIRLGEIGRQGWNVLRGDVPLPLLVLDWADVEHNIALMQTYCDERGAWLAPHGKTTMAPQIWAAQLKAGAWAITVANIAQVEVCRAFGVPRILIANELASDYDVRSIARLLGEDSAREVYCLVDSERGVERLARGLARAELAAPLRVMVELGMPGGRCGARSLTEVQHVAEAVRRAAPQLELVGVEGYEGIVSAGEDADTFLKSLSLAVNVVREYVPANQVCLVSAGGSVFFDRVFEIIDSPARPDVQIVLRSGCYVTHDSGRYDRESPFGAKARNGPGPILRAALEVWSAVLSRPEHRLAMLGMGKRDVPFDMDLPIPLWVAKPGHDLVPLNREYTVLRLNDQHAYLQVPAACDLAVGDLVACGISHPCTAFDKWRIILCSDAERKIVGAIQTYF